MNRREFLAAGIGGAVGLNALGQDTRGGPVARTIRSVFPRVEEEVYLNAAGLMPLSAFTRQGIEQYLNYQMLGPGGGRGDAVAEMRGQIRGLFAELIGAQDSEVGFVYCTKAGEQMVLDALPELRSGGNIVTNDLHFTGSLHNLLGLKRAGVDVRIVRSKDWKVTAADMGAAMDERTALVSVSYVSNVNGHIEDLEAISKLAHERGAIVYADIIQAAGIVPLNVHELGIDVAACSCYKWLYGTYGTGFLFVKDELQGGQLQDRLFPGYAKHNYQPWVESESESDEEFGYWPPTDARRYQAGHVSYLGYSGVFEGLKFLRRVGVSAALRHSVRLNKRLLAKLNMDRYRCISPNVNESPMISFLAKDAEDLQRRVQGANVVASLSGRRIRVSPGLYNNDQDIDVLVDALNA